MTFTNEILNAHDVKVLELSHFQRAALGDFGRDIICHKPKRESKSSKVWTDES